MATLVSAEWVEARLGNSEFLVIDTRSAMRYLMGHLKSAVSAPQRKMLDPQGRLLPVEDLARLFGGTGLGHRETPVVYDGPDGRNGAMVAWALEYLGRGDVHIMEVFFDRWKNQGREIFYRPVPPEAKHFTARVNPALRATIDDISGVPDLRLVDTRSREEYNGDTETDEKPGHIPGAVNIDWQDMLGEGGQLLGNQDKVQNLLSKAGISRGDKIVTYCKVGARASVAYLALKQLGYDVRVYDASYTEWEQSGQPVELKVTN